MSLDYDKIKSEEETPQTSMSAYSDLFAALAFVFLFLYVISTIQLSLQTISSKLEAQKLEAALEKYELPSEMSARSGSEEAAPEVDYEKVLGKLAALEQQTRRQSEQFYQQARTLQESEQELISQYQTVVEHVKEKNLNLRTALAEQKSAAEVQQVQYEEMLASLEKLHVGQVGQFQEQLSDQERKLEQLQKIQKTAESENVVLLAKQTEMRNELAATKQRLSEILEDKAAIEEERESLTEVSQALRAELDKSRAKMLALEKGKRDAFSERDKLLAGQMRLKNELDRSNARLLTLEKNYKAAEAEKKRLIISEKKMERELGRAGAKLRSMEKGQRVADAEKNKYLAAQKKLQRELDENRARLAALERGAEGASADKKKLLADQERLKGALLESNARLAGLEKESAAAEKEKGKLVSAQQALKDELDRSRARLAELAKGKEAAEGEKDALLADQQKLLADLGDSRSRLKGLEKSLAESEGEKDEIMALQKELEKDLGSSKAALTRLEKDNAATGNELARVMADQQKLKKTLDDIKAREQLRQNIISSLKDNFDRHGIDAEIDEDTGEVTLPFDKAYFDFDSAELKKDMKDYLRKIIPIYSKSIFEESGVDEYIKSIEVIGYASPIYLGKYVNPESLSAEARAALNYNMDLSYRRARAIFKYILNKQNLEFPHQKEMMLRLKVTGRSYLESTPLQNQSGVESIGMQEFCSQYDCDRLQSAIIRFNLED